MPETQVRHECDPAEIAKQEPTAQDIYRCSCGEDWVINADGAQRLSDLITNDD